MHLGGVDFSCFGLFLDVFGVFCCIFLVLILFGFVCVCSYLYCLVFWFFWRGFSLFFGICLRVVFSSFVWF